MTRAELDEFLPEISAVVAGVDDWTDEVFAHAPKLKVIARFGVGVDNIDLAAAKARGIKVTNARGANADAVAELAIGGMLAMLRNFAFLDRTTRAGKWERSVGHTLRGRVLGLVGFGAIARYVAKLARAFDAEVLAFDSCPDEAAARDLGVRFVPLDALLAASDVVSLHVPATPETKNLINSATLARMKPGAILINTARGAVVDEAALFGALKSGRLSGAVLDVHATEPTTALDPLFSLPNVLVFPHTAAETWETYHQVGLITAEAVADVVKRGKEPVNWLNR
jgi:D-3-phosphoglycerate dehydrogenase